ncbi:hypothetical protein [Amycolatopsis azurea]|uniref:Uncharacterized protein n=1 Tax=Amycolatopsis azurea DSM 43854 TaxID=1238180 RepID=M2Q9D2_9PSEU|nr:hypothetical protein [Amycolatopsis azurea]EMD22682.1 hypothetical protein C791_8242 [Amycolatopsis azurea DSM 43854]OOC00624.1 hypothetical protein B0293_41980 [Amycolatopsis azurea DSM 43854]
MHPTFTGNLNFGEMNGVKVVNKVQAALEHLNADDAYLNLTLRLFAPPDEFDNTYARWRDGRRLLVLARQPGTGRTMIAHALLATIREESQRQVNVGALHFGGGETFPIDRLPPAHRNWAYVVEVPPDEEGFTLRSRLFRMTLTQLEAELKRRECWLIFLMSPEQWTACVDETISSLTAEIGNAVPAKIVRKALAVQDPALDVERWLAANEIKALLADQPPAEVLDIVELIRSAAHAAPGQLVALQETEEEADHAELADGGDRWFARRVQTVVEARRNWRKQLLSWHRHRERTSLQRSFLLAAAALPSAPGAYVYALANKLEGKLSGKQQSDLAALSAPGIIELVDAIEADLADDDTVVFRHDGWDDAALHYFWTDRPFSRQTFLTWLAEAPTDTHRSTFESLTGGQQQELAARIARFAVHWAARQQRPEPLAKLASTWYDSTLLWQVFVAALDEAATQSSTHRYIHSMLLNWVTRRKDLALWRAVAEVCGLEFGRRHTGKALRRLKHVAAIADPEIEQAVQRSVITLWDDTSVRETLFDTVIGWCENPATTSVAYRAFSALAAKTDHDQITPTLLARGDQAGFIPSAADLATGWTVLLSPQGSKEAEQLVLATVHQWLDVALRQHQLQDDVLGLLRNAVNHPEEPGVISPRERLRHYLFTWLEASDGTDITERNNIYLRLSKLFDGDFSRRLTGDDSAGGTDHVA